MDTLQVTVGAIEKQRTMDEFHHVQKVVVNVWRRRMLEVCIYFIYLFSARQKMRDGETQPEQPSEQVFPASTKKCFGRITSKIMTKYCK